MKKKLNVILDFGEAQYQVGSLFLSEKMGKYVFSYTEEFLSSGLEISPKEMPLSRDTYTCDRDIDQYDIHGVFADSLPDAWGKLVQDAEFNKLDMHEISTLDRLAFVGKHGIGALRYQPSEEYDRGEEIVTLAEIRKAMQGIYEGDVEKVTNELLHLGGSAGGAHPKFLVDLNIENLSEIRYSSENISKNMVPVLLKIPKEKDLWQRIEYCYSRIARSAYIKIPETYLVYSESGKAHYAIQRFDIVKGNRLHTHSYAGIDGFSFRRDDRDYLDLLRMIYTLSRNHAEVIEGYRRMVFNYLACNEDDHGKNFSFTMDSRGEWFLSPAYDLGYSDNGGIHRMSVNGKRSSIRVQDLEHVAEKFQIKNWQEITRQIIDALYSWPAFAEEYKVPERMSKRIGEKIEINIKRIKKDL